MTLCQCCVWPVALVLAFASCSALIRIPLYRQEVSQSDVSTRDPGVSFAQEENVIVRNYKNVYYHGEVRVGTPGDRLQVIFDTGSPSLWVYAGSGWRSWLCLLCWFKTTYHHSRSRTYIPLGDPVAINYVSSYVRGYTSSDLLRVGNLSVRVTLTEATTAPFLSSLFAKYDGILGLAPCSGPSCPHYTQLPSPVVNSLLEATGSDLFSVYLDRSGNGVGEITIGGTNPELYDESTLKMHPTIKDYVWSVKIDSVWVGEKLVLNYTGLDSEAYVDTGTSLIVGPTRDVKLVLEAAGMEYGLQVPCGRISRLPNITFVIGGERYPLQPKDYASVREKPIFGSELCYHGLEGAHLGTRTWLLGDVFLGSLYTIFRAGGGKAREVGFARLTRPGHVSRTSS